MQASIRPKRQTRRPRALCTAAALVSGLLIAGCGGGSGSPTVAAAPGATAAGSTPLTGGGAAGSGPSTPAALETDALAYSKCMRSNGVPNFPDPQPGGDFEFQRGSGLDPSSSAFKAAQAKCLKLLPGGGPPGPGTQTHPSPQALAQMVKVAQCMRRQGIYNFPDPRTSIPSNMAGVRVISIIYGVVLVFPATIDEQSPLFTRAAATCNFPLHNH